MQQTVFVSSSMWRTRTCVVVRDVIDVSWSLHWYTTFTWQYTAQDKQCWRWQLYSNTRDYNK